MAFFLLNYHSYSRRATKFTPIYYSWRPTSPDPGDDLVIDCGMNVAAIVVTLNIKDFRRAQESLGLQIMTPTELIIKLAE